MTPDGEKNISRSGERVCNEVGRLLGGSQGSRLGSTEDDITNGIVLGDPIPISPTADLVVSKRVSCVVAFRAGVGGAVKRYP